MAVGPSAASLLARLLADGGRSSPAARPAGSCRAQAGEQWLRPSSAAAALQRDLVAATQVAVRATTVGGSRQARVICDSGLPLDELADRIVAELGLKAPWGLRLVRGTEALDGSASASCLGTSAEVTAVVLDRAPEWCSGHTFTYKDTVMENDDMCMHESQTDVSIQIDFRSDGTFQYNESVLWSDSEGYADTSIRGGGLWKCSLLGKEVYLNGMAIERKEYKEYLDDRNRHPNKQVIISKHFTQEQLLGISDSLWSRASA